jgi:tetratricopeptide (TPR) repeat protein
LLDAMAKARVDYVVAQYLANIYLFYKRDYAKAIEYYRKAARYSEPESGHHAAVALMHEGLAHYFAAGDDPDGTNQFAAAAECLKRAQVLMPGWLELKYQFAQYSVLANNRQEGLKAIRSLLDLQPLYILKIAAEEDFLSVREEIAKIVDEMHHNFTSNLAHELNSHKIFITTLRGHYGENFDRDEVKTYLSVLKLIGDLLASGDFVSIVRALEMEDKLHYPTANPRKLSPRHAYGPYGYKQASSYGSSSPARQPYETSWPIGGELI